MLQLGRLRASLAAADGAAIEAVFANAQQARQNWIRTIEAAESQKNIQGGD
jgi:prephenate dehydrogenase